MRNIKMLKEEIKENKKEKECHSSSNAKLTVLTKVRII